MSLSPPAWALQLKRDFTLTEGGWIEGSIQRWPQTKSRASQHTCSVAVCKAVIRVRNPLTEGGATLVLNSLHIEHIVKPVRCMSTIGTAQSTAPIHLSAEEMPRICAMLEVIIICILVAASMTPLLVSGGRTVDQWRTPHLASYILAAAIHRWGCHIWHWVRSESSSKRHSLAREGNPFLQANEVSTGKHVLI